LRNVSSQVNSGARDVACGYCFINEFVNSAAKIIITTIVKDNTPPTQRYKIDREILLKAQVMERKKLTSPPLIISKCLKTDSTFVR
jgi:hypothetical protein